MGTQRLHVLVVDDMVDMARSTAEMLTLWGFDARACDSGAMALACARTRCPAAVVLDLLMPQLNGFQFAEAFRRLPACGAVPLVAVSGYWTADAAARAFRVGIGHYLLKPADPDQLKEVLVVITRDSVPSGTHEVKDGGLGDISRARRSTLIDARSATRF